MNISSAGPFHAITRLSPASRQRTEIYAVMEAKHLVPVETGHRSVDPKVRTVIMMNPLK